MSIKSKLRISYNSPVILTFAAISLVSLILGYLSGGMITQKLFMVYRSSPLNPLTYLRLFTHIVGHADLAHFTGNFTLILILGPLTEEKYGSRNLLIMMLITAVVTGLFNILLFPSTALCGASGVVFMLIILSSFSSVKNDGGIPLTLILVAIIYIGNEIITGITQNDNISQLTHIIGGICGGSFGFILKKKSS